MSQPIIDIQAVIAVAREAATNEANKPEVRTINGVECLVAKTGAITPLVIAEKHLDNPKRKRAFVQLHETKSFIDYVNAHKIEGRTHIFGEATEHGGVFRAVIDYHEVQKNTTDGARSRPGWCEHIVMLALAPRPEWLRWVQNSGKLMPQEAFAEFIDENLNDIIEPAAADILEMAQGLQGRKNVSFKSGRNLSDGAIKLEYVESIEVQGSTNRRDDSFKVPASFRIAVVPFVGAAGVEIAARLRFRIGTNGQLSFAYVLDRPYKVIESAFVVAREDIEKGVGLNVALGSGRIVPLDDGRITVSHDPTVREKWAAGLSFEGFPAATIGATRA